MRLRKKILMFGLSLAMVVQISSLAYAGVIGKSSKLYPLVQADNTEALLGGGEINLLGSATASQNMSYVITTRSGKVIVVDGGLEADAPHLVEVIKSKGCKVSAWFLSHPHSDHVGAITKIVNDGMDGISIDAVYYNIREQAWYEQNEKYRADTVAKFRDAMAKLPEGVVHSNVQRGTVINLDDVSVHVINNPYYLPTNSINNSSVVYRMDFGPTRVLFLGDMGAEAGEAMIKDVPASELDSDIVQMAHHGQYGVTKEVYQIISPKICMWNTPQWLWDNDGGGGYNTGNYKTLEVRSWMEEMGVKANYVIKDGDQTIK